MIIHSAITMYWHCYKIQIRNLTFKGGNNIMWLIYKAWTDPSENNPARTFGYELLGFTTSGKVANSYRDSTEIIPANQCWIPGGTDIPLYKVEAHIIELPVNEHK